MKEPKWLRERNWRVERYKRLRPDFDPHKCQRHASVSIDGKPYCSNHAGAIALEILIGEYDVR